MEPPVLLRKEREALRQLLSSLWSMLAHSRVCAPDRSKEASRRDNPSRIQMRGNGTQPTLCSEPIRATILREKKQESGLKIKENYSRDAFSPCPRWLGWVCPSHRAVWNGSLLSGPCRSSPCQLFLLGRISLYSCHGRDCFPRRFPADLTQKAWHVLFRG